MVDPVSEKFAHVSTYNYSENEPVANIDLWGLQKLRFDSKAANNSTFIDAYSINRQTSGGKNFIQTLKSQSKIDVVYAILERGADGVTLGPYKSFEEFKTERGKSFHLYYSTEDNWQEYEGYFEEGKELLIIGTNCMDDCEKENIRGNAHTINHEEVAHAINDLNDVDKSLYEEHKDYNHQKGQTSPDKNEIKNNSKYKNSPAKKQLDEIDKIMKNENN